MKKNRLLFLIAVAAFIILLAIGIGRARTHAAEVEISDPNLKQALQEVLGVTTVTADRLDDLQELDLSDRSISSLAGLEEAINLRVLSLRNNQVKDLTPLSSLTNLQSLDLCGNQVSTLTALKTLSDLRILQLTGNQVNDLSPVTNLKHLQFVFCENNALDLTEGSDDRNVITILEKRGIYVVTSTPSYPEPDVPAGAEELTLQEGAALSLNEENILVGAPLGTTVEQLTAQLVYTGRTLTVLKADGTEAKAGDLAATGMTVKMVSAAGETLDTCTVAVYGDVNGDGRVSVTDYLLIRKHLLGIEPLQGALLYGGDHNGDGQLTITDALQSKAYILDIE